MRWTLATCAVTLGVGFAPAASADAVPPEPDHCPRGQVPVSDHGGSRCEKEAPTNCPPGWRGVIGGNCTLHVCSDDTQCAGGKVCRDFSLCYQAETHYLYKNRHEPTRSGEVAMSPPEPRDKPVTEWIPKNVCDQASTCAAPAECRPGKLCVPKGSSPASTAPGSGATGPKPSADAVPAKSMPTKSDGTVDTKPSGCGGGCAGAPTGPATGALLTILGAMGAGLWRRRRAR